MIVDLHCHSIFSDGALSPEELVSRANKIGAKVFALTDHDTIAGLPRLHAANIGDYLKIINGVEISMRWRKYDIHVLAYNFSATHPGIIDLLAAQKDSRLQRAHAIAERLQDVGVHDAFAKAAKYARNENFGRPHFAQVLIDEGKVKEMQKAFDQHLARGKHAYVKSCWVELEDAISVVRAAGGNAVIAHPLKYKLTNTKLIELVTDFKQAGGEGIEVVSTDAQTADINLLADICVDFSLCASTGSDFHNDKSSRVGIGMQRPVPKSCTPIWDKWSLS